MSRISLATLAAVMLLGGGAHAAVVPHAGPGDPRVKVVRYIPDEVVLITGALGYAMTLEFGPGERIENVSIGDSLAWQVTPNRRANLLFLKPVEKAAATNMTVITNLRSYAFDMRIGPRPSRSDRNLIFAVKFEYPEPAVAAVEPPVPPPPPAPPEDRNHAYRFQGSTVGLPTRVFDDGRATYFTFADSADLPAIFAVEADKKESAVNVAVRDGFLIVDRLAAAFVLRRGAEITRVLNDGYGAPKAKSKKEHAP